MSLALLIKDEFKGFYKSNVMIILWIGLPLLSILFHLWALDIGDEMPLSFFTAIILSSLGGLLASIMLTVHIIHERNLHVYELFLIRPVKRQDILIAKFFAVYICVAVASALAIFLGLLIDFINYGEISNQLLNRTFSAFAQSLSTMAIYCSAGVLIGISVSTVLVGIILAIFVSHNFSSFIALFPTMFKLSNPLLLTSSMSIIFTIILLIIAIVVFNKKQF